MKFKKPVVAAKYQSLLQIFDKRIVSKKTCRGSLKNSALIDWIVRCQANHNLHDTDILKNDSLRTFYETIKIAVLMLSLRPLRLR